LTPAQALVHAAGWKAADAYPLAARIVKAMAELGYEITPIRCPTCERFLSLSCAVCGQVET
jgi:hypothetical protein